MKSIMQSVQPKWVEKILNGEKTVEVRKTRPKLETPFKVYIYETKEEYRASDGYKYNGQGKVVAEYICDYINVIKCDSEQYIKNSKESCLSLYDFISYCNGKELYGWHISDLVVYDAPKELSEFGIKRAPQSWLYVEMCE